MKMDGQKFDQEVDDLIEWCDDLDFDKYMESWHSIATSNKPDVPAISSLQVFQGNLGEISIGLAENRTKDQEFF